MKEWNIYAIESGKILELGKKLKINFLPRILRELKSERGKPFPNSLIEMSIHKSYDHSLKERVKLIGGLPQKKGYRNPTNLCNPGATEGSLIPVLEKVSALKITGLLLLDIARAHKPVTKQ